MILKILRLMKTCVNLKIKTSYEFLSLKWDNTLRIEYPDKTKSVLCIPKTDIDIDGIQYCCKIQCISGSILEEFKGFTTAPVTLRVSFPQLDQFKESLASIYLAKPKVPQDSWPPVSNKTYINLALVKQQEAINYGAHFTLRGGIDDILHHKERIEYENIFDGLRSGSLLLIEGRPGSGKTTFVHKITRDWAASEVRGPMRLVLLISLRVLNSWQKPVTLEDIFELLNVQVSATVLQERNGKGVCFIFDGLDEFSPLEGKNSSIVHKIINKDYLPQSIVIVASRPAALVKLRQRADKVIEVIGFPKDQIFEYVKNYPFSNTSKVDQLESYLLSHPNILHMCYLPIHVAMVAFLFEVMGKVPRTETEMYTHFTKLTLSRSRYKHKEQDESEDRDTGRLNGEEKELFDTICELALKKMVELKQVLDQEEMKVHLQGKDYKDISLGLVTIDHTAGLYGLKNIYTFLHLTYQEYLAAHHISTLSDEDQHKLIKEYGDTDHMQAVWKFYFGLVDFEGHADKIKALINKNRKEINLFDVQCAYESQQEMVCNCIMQTMDAQIILEDKYLSTTDFTALGYFLANSSEPSEPVSLSLIKCDLNAESANTLLAEIRGKPLLLRTLHCKSNKTDLAALVSLLRNSSEPVSLSLIKCDLIVPAEVTTGEGTLSLRALHCESIQMSISALVSLLKNSPEPVSLSLIRCDIHLTDFSLKEPLLLHTLHYESRAIFDVYIVKRIITLQHGIEHLKLSSVDASQNMDDYGFPDIVSTSLANLKELSLSNVHIGPKTLFSVLESCKELTSLTLNHSIEENPLLLGFFEHKKLLKLSYTTSCLKLLYEQDTSKQVLRLEVESHSDVLLTLFAEIFSLCDMLQELELSYKHTQHPIEIEDIILTALITCSNLQKLVLTDMHIGQVGACALVSRLQHWPKLQELHLRGCGIREEGAKAIADNIKNHPKLTEVDLSDNITYNIVQLVSDARLQQQREPKSCTLL